MDDFRKALDLQSNSDQQVKIKLVPSLIETEIESSAPTTSSDVPVNVVEVKNQANVQSLLARFDLDNVVPVQSKPEDILSMMDGLDE